MALMGRFTPPAMLITFRPSVLTANSSSSMPSCGVFRGCRPRGEAVGVLAVLVGVEVVDGAVQRLARLVARAQRRQHVVREQDGIVGALFGQALVQQLGQGVGGQVQRVARDPRPPRRAQRVVVMALCRRLLVPVLAVAPRGVARAQRLAQRVHQLGAAVVLDIVFQHRRVVVDVHVGVDDGWSSRAFTAADRDALAGCRRSFMEGSVVRAGGGGGFGPPAGGSSPWVHHPGLTTLSEAPEGANDGLVVSYCVMTK